MVMFAAKETSGALMRRARATAGPRKANSATRTRRAKENSAVPQRAIAARAWTETVVPARMVIVAPAPTETAAATPKAATASPSCPVARRLTGNRRVGFTSDAKPPPVGGGFAFLLLAD